LIIPQFPDLFCICKFWAQSYLDNVSLFYGVHRYAPYRPDSGIMRIRWPGGSRGTSELDLGPPTSTSNPREIPRPTAGYGTRIIGHKLVRSDYFNLAVIMGPGGRQNNLDKTRWSARNRCYASPKWRGSGPCKTDQVYIVLAFIIK